MKLENPASSAVFRRPKSHGKSKMIAVLLAVFLSCFGWLYTYKRNAWKFWLGSLLSGLPVLASAIFMEFYLSSTSQLANQILTFTSYAFPILVWGWAVFDNLSRGTSWYRKY